MDLPELLQNLSEGFGPPGFEDEVRKLVRETAEPLADRIEEDPLGNVTVWREGGGAGTVMLDAHTDEIGIIVSHVDEKGFARFAPLGGWDGRLFPGSRITLKGRDGVHVPAAIGLPPPHITKPEDRTKTLSPEDLVVDLGVSSRSEAAEIGIEPGAPGVLDGPFRRLRGRRVIGKAFDDRAGCAAALRVLEELRGRDLPFRLAVSFSTTEEVGLRGAKVAAYRIVPDVALVLETTSAGDFPGIPDHLCPCRLGRGPAITIADHSMITSPRMLRFLQSVGDERGIPYQLKQPLAGGTDAGAIHLSRAGALAGVLATPSRYIHSPSSILDIEDLEALVRLAVAALEEIPRRLL